MSDVSVAFVDLVTFSELESEYLCGGKAYKHPFIRQTRRAMWFSQFPAKLDRRQGTVGLGRTFSTKVSRTGDYLTHTWLRIQLPSIELQESEYMWGGAQVVTELEDFTSVTKKSWQATQTAGATDAQTNIFRITGDTLFKLLGPSARIRWCKNLAHNLIERITLTCNEMPLATVTARWLDFWAEFLMPHEKIEVYAEMTGHTERWNNPMRWFANDTSTVHQKFKWGYAAPGGWIQLPVPLPFSKETGNALPCVSLPYNEIRLQTTFAKWNELFVVDYPFGTTFGGTDRQGPMTAEQKTTRDMMVMRCLNQLWFDKLFFESTALADHLSSTTVIPKVLPADLEYPYRSYVTRVESYVNGLQNVAPVNPNAWNQFMMPINASIRDTLQEIPTFRYASFNKPIGHTPTNQDVITTINTVAPSYKHVITMTQQNAYRVYFTFTQVALQRYFVLDRVKTSPEIVALLDTKQFSHLSFHTELSSGLVALVDDVFPIEFVGTECRLLDVIGVHNNDMNFGFILDQSNGPLHGTIRSLRILEGARNPPQNTIMLTPSNLPPLTYIQREVWIRMQGNATYTSTISALNQIQLKSFSRYIESYYDNIINSMSLLPNWSLARDVVATQGTLIPSINKQFKDMSADDFRELRNQKNVWHGWAWCCDFGTSAPPECIHTAIKECGVTLSYTETDRGRMKTLPSIEQVEWWANYVVVHAVERQAMAGRKRLYLLENMQESKNTQRIHPYASQRLPLRFRGGVRALFFAAQNTTLAGERSHYQMALDRPVVCGVERGASFLDPAIVDVSMAYEHNSRFDQVESYYFTHLNPFFHASRNGLIQGLHMYSYALDPRTRDPNGHTNYDKLYHPILHLNESATVDSIAKQDETQRLQHITKPNHIWFKQDGKDVQVSERDARIMGVYMGETAALQTHTLVMHALTYRMMKIEKGMLQFT